MNNIMPIKNVDQINQERYNKLTKCQKEAEALAERLGFQIDPTQTAEFGFWVLPFLEKIIEKLEELKNEKN